uniref:Uncharacterized protein n=1 Tax=Strongyloides venezuelensis TaxID=75913 RepID=A0A0K0FX03_STRVS
CCCTAKADVRYSRCL